MRRFRYQRPASLNEAVSLLATPGVVTAALSGGTDLLPALHQYRSPVPELVVDIKDVPELATGIRQYLDRFVIGADVVMSELIDDQRISEHFPALVEAASVVGSRQIRNRATVAGNISNASPAADTATPLLAYDAKVRTIGPLGDRSLSLDEFILGPRRTALMVGELVAAVELKIPHGSSGSAFGRLTRRQGSDLATLSICVSLDAGRARVACGAVAPRPFVEVVELDALCDLAMGRAEDHPVLSRLAAQAQPITDVRASADYRRAMLLVLARRVATVAVDRRRGTR